MAFFLVFVSVAALAFLSSPYYDLLVLTPGERLSNSLHKDLSSLRAKDAKLDHHFANISTVDIRVSDAALTSLMDSVLTPIKRNPSGNLLLEVEVVGWEEKQKYGAIFLFNFQDKNSKRQILEFGRTYPIGFKF